MANILPAAPTVLAQDDEKILVFKLLEPKKTSRSHILNQLQQSNSGRLYCGDDLDVEIPSLDIYAAR
jgi:hypothetical protein